MTEFFAKYRLRNQTQEIDDLLAQRGKFASIRSEYALVQLLAHAQLGNKKVKTYAQTSNKRNQPTGLRKFIKEQNYDSFCERVKTECLAPLNLHTPSLPDVSSLLGSWTLQIKFKLRKPYISGDDVVLYILDNPLKKEWLFKIPYVAPSQWKGALRSAIRQLRGYSTWEDEIGDELMVNLFGNPKGIEEHDLLKRGRLLFYPTFFYTIGLEVINPHDRKAGTGTTPISIESVPQDTVGEFAISYFPVNCAGGEPDKIRDEASNAMRWVFKGLQQMFVIQGFGAKTSSGYGTAFDKFPELGELKTFFHPEPILLTSFNEIAEDSFVENLFKGGG